MNYNYVKKILLDNGETIAYREGPKNGSTVILVHGNMSSSVHFITTFKELEAKYHIIAIDLRGFGDSSYINEVNSLHDFAEDLKNFISLKALCNITLVGWSTGGGIVLESAADLGSEIRKVILLDSVGLKGFKMYVKDDMGNPIYSQRIKFKEELAKDQVQVVPILNAYACKNKELLKMIWNSTIYNMKQPDEDTYDTYLEAMIKQRNLIDVDYCLVHFNMTHESNGVCEGSGRIDLIKCPVVIIHGKNDMIVPYIEAEKTKEYFGNKAILIGFDNVGHSIMTDNFELFINTLKLQID